MIGEAFFRKIQSSCYFIALIVCSCDPSTRSHTDLAQYQFTETRDLVSFVHEAAALFSEKGKVACIQFGNKESKWLIGTKYIFIYDTSGTCIFHPVRKELVGKNLLNLEDLNGKPIGKFITTIAFHSKKSCGWIHYLWAEPGEIFPFVKHAYIMGVKGPDGKKYAIGSGTYNLRIEMLFVVDMVDSAAKLVEIKGADAYDRLIDQSGEFNFSDTYLFVMKPNGQLLVDPSFPTISGRNVMDFKDYAGQLIIRELLQRLKKNDVVFIPYLWPAPGQANPSKKIIYAKKVVSGSDTVIVGSSLYLMDPIWKKF
jgi:signal transduction histidine kinase